MMLARQKELGHLAALIRSAIAGQVCKVEKLCTLQASTQQRPCPSHSFSTAAPFRSLNTATVPNVRQAQRPQLAMAQCIPQQESSPTVQPHSQAHGQLPTMLPVPEGGHRQGPESKGLADGRAASAVEGSSGGVSSSEAAAASESPTEGTTQTSGGGDITGHSVSGSAGITHLPSKSKYVWRTLYRWNRRRYQVGTFTTMEEAETAKRKYFDRLEKAVTQANFVDEVSAVRKEILVEKCLGDPGIDGRFLSPGISVRRKQGRFLLQTLRKWGHPRCHVSLFASVAEAEAAQAKYFPLLEAALLDGTFKTTLAAAVAEIKSERDDTNPRLGIWHHVKLGKWHVFTPRRWGFGRRLVATVETCKQAESCRARSFPQLRQSGSLEAFMSTLAELRMTFSAEIYIANHYHGTVVFNRPHQKWQVWTPLLGAPEGRRYLVAGCRSRERAEAIRAKYVPLLRAADEAGTIDEQLPVYLDEIRAQALSSAVAEGRASYLPGVSYSGSFKSNWMVTTLPEWGYRPRRLLNSKSKDVAEAYAQEYFPRLHAAHAAGKFYDALIEVEVENAAKAAKAAAEAAESRKFVQEMKTWEQTTAGKRATRQKRGGFTGVHQTQGGKWRVLTLHSWGVRQRILAVSNTREEADAIIEKYFPRLEAAAANGTFDLEFEKVDDAVIAEMKPLKRLSTKF